MRHIFSFVTLVTLSGIGVEVAECGPHAKEAETICSMVLLSWYHIQDTKECRKNIEATLENYDYKTVAMVMPYIKAFGYKRVALIIELFVDGKWDYDNANHFLTQLHDVTIGFLTGYSRMKKGERIKSRQVIVIGALQLGDVKFWKLLFEEKCRQRFNIFLALEDIILKLEIKGKYIRNFRDWIVNDKRKAGVCEYQIGVLILEIFQRFDDLHTEDTLNSEEREEIFEMICGDWRTFTQIRVETLTDIVKVHEYSKKELMCIVKYLLQTIPEFLRDSTSGDYEELAKENLQSLVRRCKEVESCIKSLFGGLRAATELRIKNMKSFNFIVAKSKEAGGSDEQMYDGLHSLWQLMAEHRVSQTFGTYFLEENNRNDIVVLILKLFKKLAYDSAKMKILIGNYVAYASPNRWAADKLKAYLGSYKTEEEIDVTRGEE